MDKEILRKIRNKQKNISTNKNLREYSYIPSRFQHGKILWHYYIPKSKSVEERVRLKQMCITTNEDLRKYGYIPAGKQRNGNQIWIIYTPKSKSLEEKINNKQKFISTNEDILRFGYIRDCFSKKNNIQIWVLEEYDEIYQKQYKESHAEPIKKYQLEFSRTEKRKHQMQLYYENHKEERKSYNKKWKISHKEKIRGYIRKFYKTPRGRYLNIKHANIHAKRGFVQLFELKNADNIKIEYHHIASNLPFVIPVPKEIHRSIGGRNSNHYLGVTQKFCNWLKENPNIKINPLI